jgi:hypothetical protein
MPEQTDPETSKATPQPTNPVEEAYRNYLRAMKAAWAQYDVDAVDLRSHVMWPSGPAVPVFHCQCFQCFQCFGHFVPPSCFPITRVELVIHYRDSGTGNIDTNETIDRPLK